jgi:DMSO/TMAO reductase YedYZ molybdopterin-dependent catalytic subunit
MIKTRVHKERLMANETTRRDMLKTSLAAAGVGLLGVPEWALPALAQGETVVPFGDWPENFNPNPAPDRRLFDTRTISGAMTPKDQFFTTQHYGHPVVDPATFRLKVSGLVNSPLSISLDEIRKMGNAEMVCGFECSGNRRPLQGLIGNGRWTGVPLKTVLEKAGLQNQAREIVFLGADRGPEEVEFRAQKFAVEQQYGRSMPRDKALTTDAFLAYALNGEPLTRHQGAPLRLVVPGWYGAPNVKWLSEIHAQEDQYLGKFQARWYRTLKGEMINGELKWMETAITGLQLKSFVARVTKAGNQHKVLAVVLNDGTPIKSVELQIDGGAWQPMAADASTNAKYGWKFYTYAWNGAAAGEHTLVSRVTDSTGRVQPTEKELENKKTFLEDNSQHPRKVTTA